MTSDEISALPPSETTEAKAPPPVPEVAPAVIAQAQPPDPGQIEHQRRVEAAKRLIQDLRNKHGRLVTLSVDGQTVFVAPNPGHTESKVPLSDEQKAALRQLKPEIIAELGGPSLTPIAQSHQPSIPPAGPPGPKADKAGRACLLQKAKELSTVGAAVVPEMARLMVQVFGDANRELSEACYARLLQGICEKRIAENPLIVAIEAATRPRILNRGAYFMTTFNCVAMGKPSRSAPQ